MLVPEVESAAAFIDGLNETVPDVADRTELYRQGACSLKGLCKICASGCTSSWTQGTRTRTTWPPARQGDTVAEKNARLLDFCLTGSALPYTVQPQSTAPNGE